MFKMRPRRNSRSIGSSNFGGFSEFGGSNIFLIPKLCLPNNWAVNTLSVYRFGLWAGLNRCVEDQNLIYGVSACPKHFVPDQKVIRI